MSPTPLLSFEFFPPRGDDGHARLLETVAELAALQADFFSVTFGAGGSTQEGTAEAVQRILDAGHPAAPHISCIGTTRAQLQGMLERYAAMGVERIVALRGDLPSGHRDLGDFRYASELVAFVREIFGDRFRIEVAAYPEFHPESRSPVDDMRHFAAKVAAGADAAMTQYFYNVDAYFRYVDEVRALGVEVPIVPGVMPITNWRQLARFSARCEAEIPQWIARRLEAWGDDLASIRAFGHEVVTELCRRLLDGGAPGLHFYTLNRSAPSVAICRELGLPAAS